MRRGSLVVLSLALLATLIDIPAAGAAQVGPTPPWYAVKDRVRACESGPISEVDALLPPGLATAGATITVFDRKLGQELSLDKRSYCVMYVTHSPYPSGDLTAGFAFENGKPVVTYWLSRSDSDTVTKRVVPAKQASRIIAKQRVAARKACEKSTAPPGLEGLCAPA